MRCCRKPVGHVQCEAVSSLKGYRQETTACQSSQQPGSVVRTMDTFILQRCCSRSYSCLRHTAMHGIRCCLIRAGGLKRRNMRVRLAHVPHAHTPVAAAGGDLRLAAALRGAHSQSWLIDSCSSFSHRLGTACRAPPYASNSIPCQCCKADAGSLALNRAGCQHSLLGMHQLPSTPSEHDSIGSPRARSRWLALTAPRK